MQMKRALTAEIPLVGREVELDRIVAELDGPAPVAFVLAGAAGVGKTRLASEASRTAAGLGFTTAQAVASRAAASIPFGPFAPLLPVNDPVPGDLLGLLQQASDAIAQRAGPDRRLLLVVDNAHLLDDGSAALVHQLVHSASCSVVASVRTPGSAPDPVTALWKDGLADRIDLNPLSEEEVEKVTTGVLGAPIAGGAVRRLWELSSGNALYLRELLIGAVDSGALREEGGMWSLRLPLTAPDRLVELVAARLGGLGAETVAVIELVAVGEPVGVSMLEKLTDAAFVEDAERQGFLEVFQDGRRTEVRLSHPMYGEALRRGLPRSRLRRISIALAGALKGTGARRREDLLRLARWQLDAGGAGDPELLSRAARRASDMFDFDLAARLARTALDSGGGVAAGLVLGETKFRSGHHAEAEFILAGLVPLCTSEVELAQVAGARAHIFSNLMGDSAAAARVLEEASAVITDAAARLQLLGRLAINRLFEGDPQGALSAAEPLLASAEDPWVARGAYAASSACALLGRGQEAVDLAYRGLEAHRRTLDSVQLPEVQLIGAVLGHAAVGHLAQAEADAQIGYQACLAAGDKEGQATFSLLRGYVRVERGQLAAASKAFLEGATINRALQDVTALRWCLGGRALAEGMSGHPDLALSAAAELDQLPAGSAMIFELDLIGRGRAWVSVATGELSRARQLLSEAAARAAASDQRVAEARLLHDIARLGEPSTVAPQLAAIAASADSELLTALAQHADALARASSRDLEAAGTAFESFGAALLAAEADLASAALYRSEGVFRRASAMSRRAEELAASCGDVRTPGLSRYEHSDRLTRREREVAGLAANGASSREIGAKLFLSVRTVDNHLQNVYSKLGVTSRDELARALRMP
jgi:DNA-binding CsgD family transcriptional regulator